MIFFQHVILNNFLDASKLGFCSQPDVQAEMKSKFRVPYYRRELKDNISVSFDLQYLYF